LSSFDPAALDLEPLAARVASRTGLPVGRVRRVIAATFAELAAASEPPPPPPAAPSAPPADPFQWLPIRRHQGRWP